MFAFTDSTDADASGHVRQGKYLRHRARLAGGILTVLVFSLVGTAELGYAATETGSASKTRLAEFRRTYAIRSLRMGPSNSPSDIEGSLSSGLKSRSAQEQVIEFLGINRDVFGMTDPSSELKLLGEFKEKRGGTRHLRFQQMYHGLEVFGIQLLAHFSPTDQLVSIGSSYLPSINLPSTPTISEAEAKRIVTQAVASPDTLDLSRCRLIVYPRDTALYLAWEILSVPGGEYFIDALNGRVISHWSGMSDVPGGGDNRRVYEVPPDVGKPRHPLPESARGYMIPHQSSGVSPESSPRSPVIRSGKRRIGEEAKPDSLTKGHGQLIISPDLLPAPVDTTPKETAPPKTQQSEISANPGDIITIMTEGFEGAFPPAHWRILGSPPGARGRNL